jgi:hypothetical protein
MRVWAVSRALSPPIIRFVSMLRCTSLAAMMSRISRVVSVAQY